jgi:hypothetical protein
MAPVRAPRLRIDVPRKRKHSMAPRSAHQSLAASLPTPMSAPGATTTMRRAGARPTVAGEPGQASAHAERDRVGPRR